MADIDGGGGSSGDEPFALVLDRARAGGGDAFAVLYERFHRPVHAFVRARGAPDPEGMVNEVFFAAFRSLGRFEGGPDGFRSFVFRIARNRLIDEARRGARRPQEEPRTGPALTSAADTGRSGDTEGEAMARLRQTWVLEQLDRLTPDQRDVLLLRIVGDCTVESVAEALGKPVGAVKALQRRALRTLARIIPEESVPL